jgi:hypothetical protein
MSDNTLTEKDGDEEFDIIEGIPPAEDAQADDADDADDGDEDDSDERLAESEDDSDDEITSQNRKRRLKRREIQKRAKENAQRELDMLRHTNAELMRRVAAIEGHTLQSNEQGIDQRLQQTLYEIRQAEQIMARATEAGNGEDVVAAIRIRDEAMSRAQQLQYNKQQMAQVREQAAQPTGDPRVQSYASEWMQANPWYSPQGGDDDSAVVNAIDAAMTAQGYDPTSRAYWEELTRRVAARVSDDDGGDSRQSAPRRKAPPQGNTREHAPTSTRKEVYVTPERKAAMIEAGIWDDPVARNRMLKAYQAYDKNGSAS